MPPTPLNIEKLVFGGQGIAHADGKTLFVWNALPGETVYARVIKKKGDVVEAVAEEILVPHAARQEPKESFFLSTSAWDIMTPDFENEQKLVIARETYERIGKIDLLQGITIAHTDAEYGYRNKIEFSFTPDEQGRPVIGFHNRGSWHVQPAPQGTVLAHPSINRVALHIQAWMHVVGIPMRSAKALLVRSNAKGECIAALFIKDRFSFDTLPEHIPEMLGFSLFYSTHKSPASVPTELLYSYGENTLTDMVCGKTFCYGLFSFFQVNLALYEQAIAQMGSVIKNMKTASVTELYAGVGSISLALSEHIAQAHLVDIAEDSVRFAQENIFVNGLSGTYSAECVPAEKALDCISHASGLIVDPPRLGLHKDVAQKILTELPPWIVYMSCDIATHARDLSLLKEQYRILHHSLYNFFPRTPHIEALAVLVRV